MYRKFIIYLLPILSTTLLTFSGPGYNYSFLLFFAIVPLFFAIKKYPEKWLTISVIYAFTYNFINFYWVTETVNYFGDVHFIIRIVLLLLLVCYLSIYNIFFLYFLKKSDNIALIPIIFVIIEYMKSTLFTGFPWLNLGLNSLGYKPLAMNAAIVGELGISFIVIFLNFSLTNLILGRKKYMWHFLGMLILSHISYFYYPQQDLKKNEALSFALVQPSYNYLKKWEPEQRNYVVKEVMKYTEEAINSGKDIVVLPESAFPFFLQEDRSLFNYFVSNSFFKPFIVGNIRYEKSESKIDVFNSNLYFYNEKVEFYDKIHLVPFGEYFPLKFITAPIQRYFFGTDSDFTAGKEIKLFNYKEKKIGNLICYEDAFYDLMLKNVKNGAEIVVVTTNDSWFGESMGRYQHFAMSVMRSIETGRGIIRSSQSGISSCINPFGEITAKKMINEKGVLTCQGILNNKNTIFSTFGYWWMLVYLVVAIISEILYRYRRRQT